MKPRTRPTEDCWYTNVAVGHNILGNTVKRVLEQVGIKGHFTNHSLRASAATRLFEAGVDEQLIMMRTGHSSVTGVRSYKRVGEKLRAVTSNVLNGGQELFERVKKTKVEVDKENEEQFSFPVSVNQGVVNSTSTVSTHVNNATTRVPMIKQQGCQ